MRYQADHDLHIHSYISPCAGHDPRQTKEAILAYGITNGFHLLCVTDHVWDRKGAGDCQLWRGDGLDIEKAKEILPLPQSSECRFVFGIEVDMDNEGNIAVSEEEYDTFDFMIFSPSHIHMFAPSYEAIKASASVAEAYKCHYKERIYRILNQKIPFYKCGLAHFTAILTRAVNHIEVFKLFTDQEYEEIFKAVAERGMGVELNFEWEWLAYPTPEDHEEILRPYRIAKKMGCKFYLGSDLHCADRFVGKKDAFEMYINLLGLTEEDKFPLVKRLCEKSE